MVDLDRGAARWLDGRLHGFAGAARSPRGASVLLRPWIGNSRRPALCPFPDPPSPGARGIDPASPGQRRGRHPDHGARDLYRNRSAPDAGRRLFRAGAPRRPRRSRRGRDRRRSGDRGAVSVGVIFRRHFFTVLACAFDGGGTTFFTGFCASASPAVLSSSISLLTRLALLPMSESK